MKMPKSLQVAMLAAASLLPGSAIAQEATNSSIAGSDDMSQQVRVLRDKLGSEGLKKAFFSAVRFGSDERFMGDPEAPFNPEVIKALIASKMVQADEKTAGGNTALAIATMKGDTEMAGTLMQMGADPNQTMTVTGSKKPISLLDLSIIKGDTEMADALMSQGAAVSPEMLKNLKNAVKKEDVTDKFFHPEGIPSGLTVVKANEIMQSIEKNAATVAKSVKIGFSEQFEMDNPRAAELAGQLNRHLASFSPGKSTNASLPNASAKGPQLLS